MPQRNLVIISLTAIISLACYLKAEKNRDAVVISEALHTIEGRYFEEIDRRELFEGAMQGMVRKLDEHSAYFPPQQYRSLKEQLDQEFGGVGIVVELNKDTNRLTVLSPVVDTPAYKAGMRAGDVILKINDTDTNGMSLDDAVELMRGKRGEPIRLTVRHTGEEQPVQFDMKREIIRNPSVLGDRRREDGSWHFFLEDHPTIAHIRLTTFGEFTADELEQAIKFGDRPVDGLILDLRGNAGGYLKTAVDVCDLFISEGVIVSTRGRGGVLRKEYLANANVEFDPATPVVVLVDRFSASASEIVAACLQDYDRAKIIGERSWGKGTVQDIIEMEGGKSSLKLTTASYWRPNGKDIHRRKDASDSEDWGVRPDAGFERKLTDEEFKQLAIYRRHRDFINLGGPENNRPDNNEVDEPTDDAPTNKDEVKVDKNFKDPHVEKAIEYLQSISRSKSAKA